MDLLLRDIRNFLCKLKSGQLEIEVGQWELQKDITNLKKSFKELMKLKENVEDMKISNMRQLGIIRGLEAKLELYKGQHREQKKNEETTVQKCRENSRCSCDGSSVIYVQGYKTRKPRVICSARITEIASVMDTNTTHKTTSALEKREDKESDGCSAVCIQSSCCCDIRICQPKSQKNGPHNVDNSILQRYLKDTAKYCDNNVSNTTCDIYCNTPHSRRSCCSAETDESFSARGPRSSRARTPLAYRNSKNGVRSDSLHRFRSADSVKETECSKYPKKFMLKTDLAKLVRYNRVVAKPNYFCNVCRQVFESKDLLKAHKEVHCKVSRRSNVYKCSYCDMACGSPASLSLHSKKCKLIMRSRHNKQSL